MTLTVAVVSWGPDTTGVAASRASAFAANGMPAGPEDSVDRRDARRANARRPWQGSRHGPSRRRPPARAPRGRAPPRPSARATGRRPCSRRRRPRRRSSAPAAVRVVPADATFVATKPFGWPFWSNAVESETVCVVTSLPPARPERGEHLLHRRRVRRQRTPGRGGPALDARRDLCAVGNGLDCPDPRHGHGVGGGACGGVLGRRALRAEDACERSGDEQQRDDECDAFHGMTSSRWWVHPRYAAAARSRHGRASRGPTEASD